MNRLLVPGIRRSDRLFIFLTGLLTIAGALALGGCRLDDWKEEYRDEDLISNRSMSIASFADAYAGGATPASDYVNFEEITDPAVYGGTDGLPATPGAVFRLELINLMPNGDFEETAATTTPAGWTVDGSASILADDTAGLAIKGMSGSFYVSGRESARFDLRAGLEDFLVYPGTYHLDLLLRRVEDDRPVNFDYGSLSTSLLMLSQISWQTDPDPDNVDFDVEAFPNDTNNDVVTVFAPDDGTEHFFFIGAPDAADPVIAQQGHVDDIRIGRLDILPHVALSLGEVAVDGSLDIIPGRYRFSVYVKSEIDDEVTPATANAYRSGQIAIGFDEGLALFTIADEAWSTSGWVQVSIEELIEVGDLEQTEPVTLTMTVTSVEAPVIGRILIASPTFELVVR